MLTEKPQEAINKVFHRIANYHCKDSYSLADLRKHNRKRPIAEDRFLLCYLAHIIGGITYTDLMPLMCRDRTSIAWGIKKIEYWRDDPEFERIMLRKEWIVNKILDENCFQEKKAIQQWNSQNHRSQR